MTISSTDPFPLLEELLEPGVAGREAVEDGRASGYEAGLFEGRERARAEYTRRIEELLATLEDRVAQSTREVTAAWDRSAELAVELGLAVAEAILGRELEVAADPGRDALERAMRVAPMLEGVLRVRMHPEDAALLDLSRDPLRSTASVVLLPDDSVARGDCVVMTDRGDIDATVSAALERVRSVLSGASRC